MAVGLHPLEKKGIEFLLHSVYIFLNAVHENQLLETQDLGEACSPAVKVYLRI